MWIKEVPSTGKIRYCERYTDYYTGKKKDVSVTYNKDTARNRKEAALILAEKIRNAQPAAVKDITFKELTEDYLERQKQLVKPSTHLRSETAAKSIRTILGDDVIVSRITADYVMEQMLKSGKKKSTLNNLIRRFKTMIKWAYTTQRIGSMDIVNRLSDFADEKDLITDDNITEKYLESDEVKTLLDGIRKYQLHTLVISFLILSGLRIGELIALEKADINLDTKYITVNKTYDYKLGIQMHPKTKASKGQVYIQPELEKVITEINNYMEKKSKMYGFITKLFISNDCGDYLNYHTINNFFKRNTQKYVGKKLTIHSTRHTHASLLFETGNFTVQDVARRLRHGTDLEMTQKIYIHVTKKLRLKDAEKLKAVSIL